ncbi:MAG: class I SAM-dependent methyltransferase [Myxococcota bacterium]
MSAPRFSGERLHEGSARFALDLARHRAAYEFARPRAGTGWVLDLGSGSGYGPASLAQANARVVGLDRVPPDAGSRVGGALFVRGDSEALPFPRQSFELVISFQVIEHLEDPTGYLDAVAEVLRPGGEALFTTPNRLMSDGVNPFHVHEYEADELAERLRARFAQVEMRGIAASEAARRSLADRSRRIRRIMALDPLRLRDRLPRRLVEALFAGFAILVRSRATGRTAPQFSWRDFPVGPADAACLDLLAVCRAPR